MSAKKDEGKDKVAGYGRKLTWILLILVILGLISYFRVTGQLSQFIEGLRTPDRPTSSQKTESRITITKEETPRMIEIPIFHKITYGAVGDDVAYIIHAQMRDDEDGTIQKFPIPARKDRPSNWSNPIAGRNITRIGFTLDPDSALVTGLIDYVFERN